MSKQVRLRLEKIQRDFLWGGKALVHKPHLVRWKSVCLEKRKGCLGVRNLSLMNIALLCKWSWWYINEREALWRQVINQKYGEDDGGGIPMREAWMANVWYPKGEGGGWTPLSLRPLMIGS
ncbi:putative ribonuclease H protein [Vitis vinifera]|uniref:Putative ribonuclease H protein n=1 Tax=Vitis vinifera TaxID=29760 RepID=A0A438D0F3_VITVI|nr:putative ribonuclease H protein [Vitis vinifera]